MIVKRIHVMEEQGMMLNRNRLRFALLEKETRQMVCQDLFACFKIVNWRGSDLYCGVAILFGAEILVDTLKNLEQFGINPLSLFIIILLVDLCFKGTLFYYPYYLCHKRKVWPLFSRKSLPCIPKEILPAIGYYLGIITAISTMTFLVVYLTKLPVQQPEAWKWIGYVPRNIYFISFLIFSFTVVPIIEEVFFRGFIYNALKQFFPNTYAAILQAALFSMLHPYDLMNRISIFMMGMGFVIAYEHRKTLISPILVHGLINFAWAVRVLLS